MTLGAKIVLGSILAGVATFSVGLSNAILETYNQYKRIHSFMDMDRQINRSTDKHEAVSTPAPPQPGPSRTPVITPAAPTIPKFPGYDPSIAPEGYEWRGQMPQGSEKGAYFNPQTGETLHPDLNHPYPIGPHWDYRNRQGIKIRIFPD